MSRKVRETCNGQGENSILRLQIREIISFVIMREIFGFVSLKLLVNLLTKFGFPNFDEKDWCFDSSAD